MEEREIRKLFQQTGESIQALFDYFRLKDRVLWTGSQSTGSLTIPDAALYNTFAFTVGISILARRNGSQIYGIGGNSSTGLHVTREIICNSCSWNGNDLVVGNFRSGYLIHNGSGSHGAETLQACTQIIGVDPIIPDALKNLIGGG